ncbi:MAG: hypothetical protein CM1200mP37_4860 [Chloroflexota bacterium]|nr:MAG: hypothetical protein CM1200mP37_4860 [Chloroflexota bacterium]
MSKYFIDTSDIERKEAAPGLVIRTFYGERLMISFVESPRSCFTTSTHSS